MPLETLLVLGMSASILAIFYLMLRSARRSPAAYLAALRVSQERYRLITERSLDLIALVDDYNVPQNSDKKRR